MARARGEEHRFDGEAEKVDASEDMLRGVRVEPGNAAPVPSDNARQAARAARVRAMRRGARGPAR